MVKSKFQKYIFLCIYILTLYAIQAPISLNASDINTEASKLDSANYSNAKLVNARLVFDYEVLDLPNNESIDFFSTNYLHKLSNWLYLGLGIHAPLVHGNYGGFMALNVTAHLERKFLSKVLVNAGISFGGGGGGESISHSIEFSGSGTFVKSYFGLGYEYYKDAYIGLNYVNFEFENSLIKSSQLSVFVHFPISYLILPYSEDGKKQHTSNNKVYFSESFLSIGLNNIFQINPKSSNKEVINTFSLEYAHSISKYFYFVLQADVGYKGLPLYNQLLHGLGLKYSINPKVNIYNQLSIGSGGFAPSLIDTNSGLLVYSKISLEYLLGEDIGLLISSGYLFAPTGTSKNATCGLELNYHLTNNLYNKNSKETNEHTLKKVRIHLFPQVEFNVNLATGKHHNINLLSAQLDNSINSNCYFASQVSIAYNDYKRYPGYGELLFGFGYQKNLGLFEYMLQLQLGANVHGLIFKPTFALNFSLSDYYAVYLQAGKTISVNAMNLYNEDQSFNANSVGLGVTYHFSF